MRRSWMTTMIVALLWVAAAAAGAEGFQVVVHTSVEGSHISRSALADIYRKHANRWGNGVRIRPVDQSGHAPVRQAFTRDVLGTSLGGVQEYWKERLAVDREMPPRAKASDEEVLAYVASQKGAIGYVSEGVELPQGVKVVTVTE